MYKQISFIAFSLFFIISGNFVLGQESNGVVVEISKEKTAIDGKTFYLHTVKKGENIYRISKAYKVTQKDIVIYNPETISGSVKDGQVLKIPADSQGDQKVNTIESGNFIYHIAEDQQTVFSLTQKYNLSREVLYKYNPELEFSPLQVGQVVRIPKSENISAKAETFSPIEGYTEHKVKRKETKYSISKEYNITVDELIAANPILNTEDLQTGSVIRIPRKSEAKINTQVLIEKSDSVVKNINQSADSTIVNIKEISYKKINKELKIALLLPFSIEDNETRAKLDSAAMANNPKKIISTELIVRSVYSLEFYNGFLVALDSMKKRGISVKVLVFDTEREVLKVKKILGKPEMETLDLIVGPFFQEALSLVNEFSLKHRILMVSPIINESSALVANPYYFQFLPSERNSIHSLIKCVASIENRNVILIQSSEAQDTATNSLFKLELDTVLAGAYVKVNQHNLTNIAKHYAENKENILITSSGNEAVLSSVFSKLNLDTKLYSIKVFGLPQIARSLNIEQVYFHSLQFHYYSPFFIDYTNTEVKRFVSLYHRMYSYEPVDFSKEGFNFAMLGFDLGNYFLNLMAKGSDNLEENLKNKDTGSIHMQIDFQREIPGGGFTNKGTQIIQFTKDYYIKKLGTN